MKDNNSHISDTEIEQDISDTEHEIETMQKEIASLELMPRESGEFRMAQFRASARRHDIKEHEAFIVKLRGILASRKLAL